VLAMDIRDLSGDTLDPSPASPWRRRAAFVVRGEISGVRCVLGIGRARNGCFPLGDPLELPRLGRAENCGARVSEDPEDGVSTPGGALKPSLRASRIAESIERTELRSNSSFEPSSSSVAGRSLTGKGGLEANKDAIWISACSSCFAPIIASSSEGINVRRTWTARLRSRT